jgi:hypothetical protein
MMNPGLILVSEAGGVGIIVGEGAAGVAEVGFAVAAVS